MKTPGKNAALIVAVAVVPAVGAGPLDPPAGYYASAEGLRGAVLASALHDIIDDHTVIPYEWDVYRALDEAPSSPESVVLVYSGFTRLKTENGGNIGDWNREHVWPRSYGIGSTGMDNSDVFNIRPCDVRVNSTRGSLVFDVTDASDPNASFSVSDAPDCSLDSNSWEPRDTEKGDLARSCFYMAVRYDGSDFETTDLELSDAPNSAQSRFGNLLTLLQWHREDPVSEEERLRNQRVFEDYQHNRNPFIDRPGFAERVFLEGYPALDSDADGLSDYWEWWAAGSLAPSGDSDADRDGLPALLEFAMLTDPTRPDAHLGPSLSRDAGHWVFSYRKNRRAGVLSFEVETSSDLASASWIPAQGNETVQAVNPEMDIVRVFVPVVPSDDQRFFRLFLRP